MEVRVLNKHLPIAPQKLRLVCDQVRGMGAEQALTVLKFMPQKGAEFVGKSVASALANAVNNFDLNRSDMFVATIFADEGPSLKRVKAGARGRYKPRIRRTSHLTVVLAEREEK
ncbi:MAG: 50S ribosomal protein L22 [Anaerolineae bacterium]|nr:50S ribosomal protein L22 [Anaerolineae bacterium]